MFEKENVLSWQNIIHVIEILIAYYFGKYVGRKYAVRGARKMPIGVIVNNVSDKLPLLTLPPDGYVIVRRMNYGETLQRSAMATKFIVGSDANNSKNFSGEMDIQTEEVAFWDFANLVVEHNVQDKDGRVLNFKDRRDVAKLDAPVGTEIGKVIDDFNAAEESDAVKN